MNFGQKLRTLREEKSLTQKELGNILDISDRVIGYYESGDRFPKDESKLKQSILITVSGIYQLITVITV